jgi:hypothetical protein
MKSKRYLLVAVLSGLLVAGVLLVVALRPVIPSLANILMFLVGLFAMASVSAFHRLLETTDGRPLVQITFNEHLAASQLGTAARHAGMDFIDAEVVGHREERGEVTPQNLLGQDNSLALAKLRIDIERELKRVASSVGLDEGVGYLGIRRLATELAKRQVLDPGAVAVLDDILSVANQAVHGKEVSTDTAAAVIRLGEQLIGILRVTAKRSR